MLCYRCGSHVPDGSSQCGTCGQAFTVRGKRPTGPPKLRVSAAPSVDYGYEAGDRVAARYEIKRAIGQGPIGVVYRAVDREIEVEVAVKVINPKLLQSEEEREAFLREARLARSLGHVGCVRAYDEGFDGARPFLVSQYLEGLSLRKIIDLRHEKGQIFSLDELEPIFQQLALALEHAHRQKVGTVHGIAHGHLKPQNVVVLPDVLKILDFREVSFIPRLPYVAAQRVRGGDVSYLAPEVIEGQEVTPAADMYALGILLGEMLAGKAATPERGVDLSSVEGVPRAMEGIFRRLVAERPTDRYGSMTEVLEDFSAVVEGDIPPHASARRPSMAASQIKRASNAEVLESGEFELLDEMLLASEDDQPLCLEPDSGWEPDQEAPWSSGEGKHDGPEGEEITDNNRLRRRESFGLEASDARSGWNEGDLESSESLLGEMDDSLSRPPLPGPPLEAHLLQDDTQEMDPPAPEEPTARNRFRGVGRVARPLADDLEDDPVDGDADSRQDDDRAAGVEADPAPQAPKRVGGRRHPPGDNRSARTARDQRAKGAFAQPRRRSGAAWGWSLAVVLASALGGLALALVVSEEVRSAFGLISLPWARGADPSSYAEPSPPAPPPLAEPSTAAEADPMVAPARVEGAAATVPDTETRLQPAAPPQTEPEPVVRQGAAPTKAPTRVGPRADSEKAVAAATPRAAAAAAAVADADRCPDGMVFVPTGRFQLGSAINDPMRNFAEHALTDVQVDAYCIDRYEYPGRGRLPIVNVTWYRAKELCESLNRRLCSEEEWERACKGPRNFRFPYGNTFDPNACNTEDASGNPRDVSSTGAFSRCRSELGVFDMSGNVAEWTASRFQSTLQDRTHKGGAANRPDWDSRCATRGNRPPNSRDRLLGFRCCADPL